MNAGPKSQDDPAQKDSAHHRPRRQLPQAENCVDSAGPIAAANSFRLNRCNLIENKRLYQPLESTLTKNRGGAAQNLGIPGRPSKQ